MWNGDIKMTKNAKENIICWIVVVGITVAVCFDNKETGASIASYIFPVLFVTTFGEYMLYRIEKNFRRLYEKRMALKSKKVTCFILQLIIIFAVVMMVKQSLYISIAWNVVVGLAFGAVYAIVLYITSSKERSFSS